MHRDTWRAMCWRLRCPTLAYGDGDTGRSVSSHGQLRDNWIYTNAYVAAVSSKIQGEKTKVVSSYILYRFNVCAYWGYTTTKPPCHSAIAVSVPTILFQRKTLDSPHNKHEF